MADTIRELIISDIITKLGEILTYVGYNSNIGGTVERAKKSVEEKNLPACVVLPKIEDVERKYSRNNCTFSVNVQAFVLFGSINPNVIQEQILGDLIRCLTNPTVTVSTYTTDIKYTGGGPEDFPEEGELVTGVNATFEIKYETAIGDPYNQ